MRIATWHVINDWKQLLQIGRCNWYSFHFWYLYFEIDEMSKMYEVTCALFGFGVSMRLDRDFEHSEIKYRADEAREEIKTWDEVEHETENL